MVRRRPSQAVVGHVSLETPTGRVRAVPSDPTIQPLPNEILVSYLKDGWEDA
ncbi:MAG: hypothetical protein ABIQ53_14570 [Terracoccus sp.]